MLGVPTELDRSTLCKNTSTSRCYEISQKLFNSLNDGSHTLHQYYPLRSEVIVCLTACIALALENKGERDIGSWALHMVSCILQGGNIDCSFPAVLAETD